MEQGEGEAQRARSKGAQRLFGDLFSKPQEKRVARRRKKGERGWVKDENIMR